MSQINKYFRHHKKITVLLTYYQADPEVVRIDDADANDVHQVSDDDEIKVNNALFTFWPYKD